MSLHFHPDVREKLDIFIYPPLLIAIIVYQWVSQGLSFVAQGWIQGDERLESPAWYYHKSLVDGLPGSDSAWLGLLWLVGISAVIFGLYKGLNALIIGLYIASAVPFLWVILFSLSALKDQSASFSGCIAYLTLTFLAVITGAGLKGKVGLDEHTKSSINL